MMSRAAAALLVLLLSCPGSRAFAQSLEPEDPGWSRGAGIAGVSMSVGVLSLGLASELTRDHLVPSLPLGIAATVLLTVDVPVAFAGGAATRARTGVRGVPALRVIGWILYGASLAGAAALVGIGVANRQPPPGLIASISAIGASAGLSFSFDDFVIHSQAEARTRAPVAFVSPRN